MRVDVQKQKQPFEKLLSCNWLLDDSRSQCKDKLLCLIRYDIVKKKMHLIYNTEYF